MPITRGASVAVGATVSGSTTTPARTTQASGSLIVVGAVWQDNATPPTLVDSKGNNLAAIGVVRQVDSSFLAHAQLWACPNAVGGSNHTVTATKVNAFTSIFFVEYLGIALASALDQNTGASLDTVSPLTSGAVTTTSAAQLLIGLVGSSGSGTIVYTPGNGFTTVGEVTDASQFWTGALVERIVSAVGSYETSVAAAPLTSGAALIATFKGADEAPVYPYATHHAGAILQHAGRIVHSPVRQ